MMVALYTRRDEDGVDGGCFEKLAPVVGTLKEGAPCTRAVAACRREQGRRERRRGGRSEPGQGDEPARMCMIDELVHMGMV